MATQVSQEVGGLSDAAEPKQRRQRKTFSVAMQGPDGAVLRVSLRIRKDGTTETWVSHKPKGGKSVRGASQKHANTEAAHKAMESLVEKALKMGWEKKVRVGFQRKPDAFGMANLPAPAAPKAKKTSGRK